MAMIMQIQNQINFARKFNDSSDDSDVSDGTNWQDTTYDNSIMQSVVRDVIKQHSKNIYWRIKSH